MFRTFFSFTRNGSQEVVVSGLNRKWNKYEIRSTKFETSTKFKFRNFRNFLGYQIISRGLLFF
jgi:hypothetical protein